jgi:hypothetical protein
LELKQPLGEGAPPMPRSPCTSCRVFAVFYGAVLLDEQLTVASLAGLVLVVAGSALAAARKEDRVTT